MELEFTGEVWYWKGPAPWHFITVPDDQCAEIEAIANTVTYGWGMIPVTAQIGRTRWTTSLWPKDDSYIVPIKTHVRRAENLDVDDTATVLLTIDLG